MNANTEGYDAQEIRERDGLECRFCGKSQERHISEHGHALHVHHIIPRSVEGSDHPENLITVCRSCHTTIENTQGKAFKRLKNRFEEKYSIKEPMQVFAWLENSRIEFNLVVKGLIDPDVKIVATREDAVDEYVDYDGPVSVETRTVDAGELFVENLRIAAPDDVDLLATDYGGPSDEVEKVVEPKETDFRLSELKEAVMR